MIKYCCVYGLAILTFLAASLVAKAANYCVGPSATGSGSGADWNNLKAWSGTPARGDTWYLVAGNYSSKIFSVSASGTTLITIIKATASNYTNVTAAGWSSSMANQAVFSAPITFTTSYWVFDGITGGMTTNTTAYGFSIAQSQYASQFGSSSIQNITCSHIYALAISGDPGSGGKYAFGDIGSTAGSSNITFSYNLLDGWQVFFFCSGPGGQSSHVNWVIDHNICVNQTSYSDAHGCSVDADYGMTSPVISFNIFRHYAAPDSCATCTIEANNGDISGAEVYGNVFDGCVNCNEVIGGTSAGRFGTSVIYNNTFYSCTSSANPPWFGAGTLGGSGNIAYNNLIVNMQGNVGAGVTDDYNAYYSTTSIPSETHGQISSGNPFNNEPGWDYTLKANTSPGVALSAPYSVNMFGNTRTTWTRGAFEYGATSTNALISVSPSTLNFGSVLIGVESNLTFTVKNIGGGTLAGTASVAAPFSVVSGGSYTLGANQSQTVTVGFTPSSAGGSTSSVTFTGGGGTIASVSGQGIAERPTPPPTPQDLRVVAGP